MARILVSLSVFGIPLWSFDFEHEAEVQAEDEVPFVMSDNSILVERDQYPYSPDQRWEWEENQAKHQPFGFRP